MRNTVTYFRFLGLILIISALINNESYSQRFRCPRAEVDCQGLCGRFYDSNEDSYCDYSEFSTAVLEMLKARKDSILNILKKDSIAKQTEIKPELQVKDKKGITEIQQKKNEPITNNPSTIDTILTTDVNDGIIKTIEGTSIKTLQTETSKIEKAYPLASIGIPAILLYVLSLMLTKRKIISQKTQRQFWNILLLVSFLVSGLSGLLMVAILNYNILLDDFMDILRWHVIFGVVMAMISIFHALWHLKYYTNTFKIK